MGFPKELNKAIRNTTIKSVEFLLSRRIDNNFGTSVKKELTHSKFMQFCHGNPGILTPLLHFSELFPEAAKALNLDELIINHMNTIWE